MNIRRYFAALGAAAAMLVAGSSYALADTNPYQRGPDPTEASVAAQTGPFAVAQQDVTGASGFAGGTIFYPKDETGTFAGIAVSPGFMSPGFFLNWYGQMLASNGFVVLVINTFTPADPPGTRGDELQAALNYLVNTSPVKDKVDPSRLGLSGHSMGGGGTLEAASKLPNLKADVPLAPWDLDYSPPPKVKAPTMIIGGSLDVIAPTGIFAEPFYNSLTTPDKAYVDVNNADHIFGFLLPNPTITKYSLSWFKRFLDNDTRYDQFLCPTPAPSSTVAAYKGTCPLT